MGTIYYNWLGGFVAEENGKYYLPTNSGGWSELEPERMNNILKEYQKINVIHRPASWFIIYKISRRKEYGDMITEKKSVEDILSKSSELKERTPSLSSGGLVQKTGFAKVHKGELVIPAETVKRIKRTTPHYEPLRSNRGQGGYFRHRREHSINRRKARRR